MSVVLGTALLSHCYVRMSLCASQTTFSRGENSCGTYGVCVQDPVSLSSMDSWSRLTVFECLVFVKEVEESQKQRNGAGNEVRHERMNIGLFR